MRVHRQAEHRDRGRTCGQTFAATTGTPCDRWRTAVDLVTLVLTLRCHGGPLHAVIAAFGLDERTVAAWVAGAGQPGQQRHPPVGPQGQGDLPPVQADERWVTRVGRRGWMALAMAVPSRLGLGGVISPQRDLALSTTLVQLVRSCAGSLAILVGVEGLASDVTALRPVCRPPGRTGHRGRPRLVREPGVRLGHMVTRDVYRRVVNIERRVVQGAEAAIAAGLATTGGGTGINTADIERLNATCRAALAPLGRRGRAIAHAEVGLTAGMWRVGCADHCCWRPDRLHLQAPAGAGWRWQERTPAMAAGLTKHWGTRRERRCDQGPLPAWVAPKRRGRPPTRALQPAMAQAFDLKGTRAKQRWQQSAEVLIHCGRDPNWRRRPSVLDQLRGWKRQPLVRPQTSRRHLKATA